VHAAARARLKVAKPLSLLSCTTCTTCTGALGLRRPGPFRGVRPPFHHRVCPPNADLFQEGCGDDEYLAAVAGPLTRILREERPDLVFFQAGVDPGVADRLGKLRLSPEGLRRRNRLVYGLVRGLFRLQASSSGRAPSGSGGDRRSRGGGVSRFGLEGEHGGGHGDEHGGMEEAAIPLVVTMGGGYPRNLDPTSSAFGATIQDHVDVYMDAARAAALPVGASLGWELECGVVLD